MKSVIQKKIVGWSVFLIPFFACAMEQEVPQISSTAVAVVEQENLPSNPLLKEFFVKSAWQEDFDQAQFYKSHPDMFGIPNPNVQSLPNLAPDVCKNVLKYLGPDYGYTKTALGFVGLFQKKIQGRFVIPSLQNLNTLKDNGHSFDIYFYTCGYGYVIQDYSSAQEVSYMYQKKDIERNEVQDYSVGYALDGVNRYGSLILVNMYAKSYNSCEKKYNFSILTCNNPQPKCMVNSQQCYLPEYSSEAYLEKCTALGLHYSSNRFGVCSFDKVTNSAKICVYDFDMLLETKDKNSLIMWQGKLPEKFEKCIFLTASTLFGITTDGKLYSMALEKDKSISVHRQFLKDADKKDLLIKKIAVDYMDPRRVVFIATEKENLYLMDLKSKKNSFVKIQDSLSKYISGNSFDYLWSGDGKILIQYWSTRKYPEKAMVIVQNFDYIPH